MTKTTWRDGINQLIEKKEFKVYKRDLLYSICKELDKRKIAYDIYNTNQDWTIKIQ